MDPVGSWSAYAASYNRLANPPSSDLHHHMGTGVQAAPSTTTQLLAAHATSSLASSAASPFNPTGFLSPPPVGYDSVFPPLFHQKAHYSIQHRPLKQPEGDGYNQMAPNTFFEQSNTPSLAWSQNNAQLPSPFGILPHESVVTNPGVSAKTYENFNAHFAAAQFNSQISDYKNAPFIDPKKRPLSPIPRTPVSTPFYQQTFPPTEPNLNYRQSDYPVRSFQNVNLQQTCNVPPSVSQGKEHRIPQPVRPQFQPQRNEKLNFPPPKLQSIQKVSNKVYESEKRVEHDSQSSPISFAMIDAQRNFLTTKHRNQPFQNIPNQQNYRFPMTPESDYQRSKSTESFGSTSSNPDCTIGLPRRPSPLQAHASPNNAPSPVYPMYNSPLTTISSPSPVQHETCFNKHSDITPPLDVSVSRSSAPYNSVITRNDVRFDRQDYNRQPWDDRQRRYSGYENTSGQNRQQYYEPSPQVNLQDLSSCRGDPMSLVKTLQQQQPEKVSEDKSKKKNKNTEKSPEVDYFSRVPPPAHHNANQSNQTGYFDSERWNLAPPPSKIFPSSPVSFGAQPPISSNLPNQHQSLMVPHPALPLSYFPSLPYIPPSQPAEETASTEIETEQPNKVIVPNIEEELRCLLDMDCENEEIIPTKKLPLNPGKGFMSSFVTFLNGEQESPPLNLRPVRRMTKPKIFQQTETEGNEVGNCTPAIVPEFPSDPQDDPRYFPLPKSSDQRSFDSSDSDVDNSFSFNSKVDKKMETPPPILPVVKELPVLKEDVNIKSERRKKKQKKKEKSGKRKNEYKEVHHDRLRPRRETSTRKAKEMSVPLINELENNSSDMSNSDSDPVWIPAEKSPNDKKKLTRSRLPRKQAAKSISSGSSDEEDVPLAERTIRKKNKRNYSPKKKAQATKKVLPQIITASKPVNHSSSKYDLPFNIGDFVVLKSDLVLRHPPLWRVKEKALVQKFEHLVKNGLSLYRDLPCFTGWSPESKFVYVGVTVKVVSKTRRDTFVQLLSTDIINLTQDERAVVESVIDSTLKYQDYFEVYVQTLFSQALDANFLFEIFQEKDEYFLLNVRTVDDHVKEVEKRLVSVLDWNDKLISAIEQYPSYCSYPKSGPLCQCGSSGSCQIKFSGIPYDKDTLQNTNEAESSVEFDLCENCLLKVEVLHKMCHFKCYLYAVCEERVKEKREAEPAKDTTVILNDLLADDVWLNQIFRSVQKEWGYAELMIGKLAKILP